MFVFYHALCKLQVKVTAARLSPHKWAKMGILGIWVSATGPDIGPGSRLPHYMPHSLSSEPQLKAIQTMFLNLL